MHKYDNDCFENPHITPKRETWFDRVLDHLGAQYVPDEDTGVTPCVE